MAEKTTKTRQSQIKASMTYNNKHEEITVRVTKDQKQRFLEKAHAMGHDSLKSFVLDCIEKDWDF